MTPVRLVYLLMLIPFTGMLAARVAIPLYALELGASAFEVGVIAAMYQVFGLLLAYAVGVVQDRYGTRAMFSCGALAGGAGMLLPYFFPGMTALYAASALLGLWSVIQVVPVQSMMGVLSPPHRVARDLSRLNVFGWLTAVAGPLVAGAGIDVLGHGRVFLALLPFTLATLGLLALWGGLLPRGQRSAGAGISLREALFDPALRPMFVLGVLAQFAIDLFYFFLPLFGHARGLPASVIGAVMAACAAGSIPAALALPRLAARAGGMRLLGASFALSALAYLLLPVFESAALLGAVAVLYGLGVGCAQTLVSLLMFRHTPKERMGAIMGTRMMLNNLVRVIGPAAFGGLVGALGLASGPLAAACVLGCASWTVLRRRREPG